VRNAKLRNFPQLPRTVCLESRREHRMSIITLRSVDRRMTNICTVLAYGAHGEFDQAGFLRIGFLGGTATRLFLGCKSRYVATQPVLVPKERGLDGAVFIELIFLFEDTPQELTVRDELNRQPLPPEAQSPDEAN
jgi:hypothetical protein